MEHSTASMPVVQPCFYWIPVIPSQFNVQQSGVTAALQAKKIELGSKVAQLTEAALQAEAAMQGAEVGAWRARGLNLYQQQEAPVKASCSSTTIMFRNMPRSLTQMMLLAELESQGFAGKFDFVYLPIDFDETTATSANFGHAFVNFVCHKDAALALECFDGFISWPTACEKPCEAVWREQCQGLAAHIKKYRNSAVMHESVPDANKPVLFAGGVRCVFPVATQPIKAPKMRRSQQAEYQ